MLASVNPWLVPLLIAALLMVASAVRGIVTGALALYRSYRK